MAAKPTPSKTAKAKSTAKAGARKGGNALTRKLGPLPAWGWLLIAGGGIYLYRKYQANSTTAAATTAAAGTSGGSGFLGGDNSGGDSGGGGGPPTPSTPAPVTPSTTVVTPGAVTPGGTTGASTPTLGASKTAASTNTPPGVAAAVKAVAGTYGPDVNLTHPVKVTSTPAGLKDTVSAKGSPTETFAQAIAPKKASAAATSKTQPKAVPKPNPTIRAHSLRRP